MECLINPKRNEKFQKKNKPNVIKVSGRGRPVNSYKLKK